MPGGFPLQQVNRGAASIAAGLAPSPTTLAGVFVSKSMTLTRAQFAALFATPLTFVPAPAANQILLPVWGYFCKRQTVASGGPSPTFRFRWAGDTTDLLQVGPTSLNTVPVNPTEFIGQTTGGTPSTYGPVGSIAAAKGKALTLGLTADPLGLFDATFVVTLVYISVTTQTT